MKQFAVRYSAAWSSQDPASLAAFHAENGSLTINDGAPAVGRAAITEAAHSFMTAYPDMVVELVALEYANGKYRYRWKFTGTMTKMVGELLFNDSRIFFSLIGAELSSALFNKVFKK